MDERTKQQLLHATKPLIDSDSWGDIENLWEPFVASGDADAQAEIAYIYVWYGFDEGPDKDREMRDLLERAATTGHADATYCLAIFQPLGERRDHLLRKAADLGNRAAQRDLGAYYATGDWTGPKDPALAVYWYTLAANQAEDDAQYNLGFMYLLGEGTEPDVAKGLTWLRLSAAHGHTGAMRLLSDLYRDGWYGIPRDQKEADDWERHLRGLEKT